MRSLGPWKLPCYKIIGFSLYQGTKTKKYIKSWDQQNYLVIRGFCYISDLFNNEVPLYSTIMALTITTMFNMKKFREYNFNPLKTSPEYTRAGVYGKCVL